jgi:L-serine dehydratase
MSQINPCVPFVTAEEIIAYSDKNNKAFWELAVLYESERSGLPPGAIMQKMKSIADTLKQSLAEPENDEIKDRILPNQSQLIEKSNNLLGGSFNKNVIKYVTRFMDIKTSMGVFVAAPTAGSCGCVSGCIFALAEELGLDDETIAKAMLSAGLIGVLIAQRSTFAAELGGCQAECGSGSGMCAAACAEILGAPVKTCLAAASMALQNIIGLVCDPVGNKVEVPCLGKNILSAFNAIASANMAVSCYDEVIPLDETIAALDSAGRSIPRELRCTGLGGLSITKTSLEIMEKSAQRQE